MTCDTHQHGSVASVRLVQSLRTLRSNAASATDAILVLRPKGLSRCYDGSAAAAASFFRRERMVIAAPTATRPARSDGPGPDTGDGQARCTCLRHRCNRNGLRNRPVREQRRKPSPATCSMKRDRLAASQRSRPPGWPSPVGGPGSERHDRARGCATHSCSRPTDRRRLTGSPAQVAKGRTSRDEGSSSARPEDSERCDWRQLHETRPRPGGSGVRTARVAPVGVEHVHLDDVCRWSGTRSTDTGNKKRRRPGHPQQNCRRPRPWTADPAIIGETSSEQ